MQQKNKKRANISIDGQFVCGLETITVLKHNLQVGQVCDQSYLEAMQLDSEKHTAFDRAIKYLGIRLRATREMTVYLQDKGYLPQTVEYCVDKLIEYGYLDDMAFAKAYVSSHAGKNGKQKLGYELRQFCVSADIIDSVLSQLDSSEGLLKLIQKKHKDDKNKTIEYCKGRGYSYDEIRQALVAYDDACLAKDNS